LWDVKFVRVGQIEMERVEKQPRNVDVGRVNEGMKRFRQLGDDCLFAGRSLFTGNEQ